MSISKASCAAGGVWPGEHAAARNGAVASASGFCCVARALEMYSSHQAHWHRGRGMALFSCVAEGNRRAVLMACRG